MRVGIIGAGPAGLTAAYELARRGHTVTVFEASAQVGGMSATLSLWGQKVDLGPHRFFSQDPRVNALWTEMTCGEHRPVKRLTRIFFNQRLCRYPLEPASALQAVGIGRGISCALSYVKQRVIEWWKPTTPLSFEDWVVSRFGRVLFETFFRDYSEKLWGIPCHELDADFAAQRIKKFSLAQAALAALKLGRRQKHATLVDEFLYPKAGTGSVYENMAKRVRELGGEILLSTKVERVVGDTAVVHLEDGRAWQFDHVISTMPLTRLVEKLGDAPEQALRAVASLSYRNTVLVYLRVPAANLFADQWIYVQSPELKLGRITNFRNWVPELYGDEKESVLALEYWCSENEPGWQRSDEEWIQLAREELKASGLDQGVQAVDGKVIRLPRCYPVYKRGYKQALEPVVKHLRSLSHLTAIGRYGAFKYNNQDHSILMGILAAENLAEKTTHDLWSVNTDYEVYQEGAQAYQAGE